MSVPVTLATNRRILTQLRHDPRTVVLMLVMPTLLMVLLRYVFNSAAQFSAIAPALLGIFPFTIMFLITSVTTLRERTSATLERLMTLPIAKPDLVFGYALAFGLIAVAQVAIAALVSVTWLGLDVANSVWLLLLVAVLDALLGTALGLFVSAFARTEFQAIQFMPVIVLPQFLLCGLLQPRDEMGWLLSWISDVLPLSYAVDALNHVTHSAELDGTLVRNMAVVAGSALLALLLGAATLRRRTP
ncbi:antibiotic ABC transporter permease [Prauserella sp. PE36]|uniref:ABC transporter permease n=1 Tax=Prauserella sp. PE36 TaxID=1504709 RepID=UPI000DE306C5|nr:ABC transporter permease [Prauserella sp. PE36]RBM24440.1 antibiotic ABC transporter permease [Prauserella sp. PE36]